MGTIELMGEKAKDQGPGQGRVRSRITVERRGREQG